MFMGDAMLKYILAVVVLSALVALNIRVSKRLLRSSQDATGHKGLLLVAIWLIPLLGCLMVWPLLDAEYDSDTPSLVDAVARQEMLEMEQEGVISPFGGVMADWCGDDAGGDDDG